MGIAGDVRDYAAVASALARTHEIWGDIDILLCGAASNFPAAVNDVSANGFKAVVDIDLVGTFRMCHAAFEHLRSPARRSSTSRRRTRSRRFDAGARCAAKAGIDMIQDLAVEWAPSAFGSP